MTARQMLCACEDVSRRDVEAAFAQGNRDVESIKRFTGLGTGICQGRSCMGPTARLLCELGQDPGALRPMTPRTPLWPTSLGALAAGAELAPIYPPPRQHGRAVQRHTRGAPDDRPSLPERVEVVIVGGGIMGLGLAYHLAKNGLRDVLVLERGYFNAGASGRNGGGIRQQFSTEHNVQLMRESMALCRAFAKELGFNTWLRQGGYLFLARTREQLDAVAGNARMHNRLGVPTRIVTPEQAQAIVPHMRVDDLAGAAFNPTDGVIFPWPFLWGYAERARALGARIETFTEVTGLRVQAGRVCAVETSRGVVRCDLVVNAAAAWAKEIARMAGVELPNAPERHEILVTESYKPFLGPLVSELGTGLYFSQSMRGEIVGGVGDPDEPVGVELRSSLRFLQRMARGLVHRMPHLWSTQVVRQWAGCYDVTPDGRPIIGEVEGVRGFFQLHGFMGHGFMMAPVVCKYVGEHLALGRPHFLLEENRLERFRGGQPSGPRETMIIG